MSANGKFKIGNGVDVLESTNVPDVNGSVHSIFIRTNLLFISFLISLFVPLIIILFHSLRNSLR